MRRLARTARLLRAAIFTGLLCSAAAATAQEVNLYTTREPGLIQPLLDAFSKDSGIKVNTVFVRDGLLERVRAEGERSPADVLMTVDTGNLLDLVTGGQTQGIESRVLVDAIPPHLRGRTGHWYALSLRDRILYADKDLDLSSFTYEELADPKWKGKVCIRSGQHPYNTSLIAATSTFDSMPCVWPPVTRSSRFPASTVISTSAGERSPSARTRSSRPSRTNTVLTLMPESLLKASSNGWIRPGSRVV